MDQLPANQIVRRKAGRPKGSKTKKRKFNLEAALIKAGVNPLNELLKDISSLDSQERARIWVRIVLALHGRPREAKPDEDAIDVTASAPATSAFDSISTAELKKFINSGSE